MTKKDLFTLIKQCTKYNKFNIAQNIWDKINLNKNLPLLRGFKTEYYEY